VLTRSPLSKVEVGVVGSDVTGTGRIGVIAQRARSFGEEFTELDPRGFFQASEFLTTNGIAQWGDSVGAASANGLWRLSGGAADAAGGIEV
jgi:hypothetical protein